MARLIKNIQFTIKNIVEKFTYYLTSCFFNRRLQKEVDEQIKTAITKMAISDGEIINSVRTRGFFIVPNAISNDALTRMRGEFRTIIDEKSNDFYAVDKHDGSVCVRIKPVLTLAIARSFPAVHTFYNSPIFRTLTKRYYQDVNSGSEYMTEIFVHETPETNDPLSGSLHWDRAQTLKFWVYLDDVSDNVGPMIVEESSAARNREVRIEMQQEKSMLVGGVDNVISQTSNKLMPMSAPAGSVLIHNTDASHGASNVGAGMVRRIIRGHCRARGL